MAYYKTPINYPTGRISQDTAKINENFTELAKSFVNEDPTTYTVINSDKVDGFHASQTPSPNTIPVADADGIIPVGFLPQNAVRISAFGPSTDIIMQNNVSYNICSITVTTPSKAPDSVGLWRVFAIVVPTNQAEPVISLPGGQDWYIWVTDSVNSWLIGYTYMYKPYQDGFIDFKGISFLELIPPNVTKTYTLQILQGGGAYNAKVFANRVHFIILLL